MSEKKSKIQYGILFILSFTFMVYLLAFHAQWFWVMLPFVGLSLVRALDVI